MAITSTQGRSAEIRRGLPGDPDDTLRPLSRGQRRQTSPSALSLPIGQRQSRPGPRRLSYKLKWFQRFSDHAKTLLNREDLSSPPVITASSPPTSTPQARTLGRRCPLPPRITAKAYHRLIAFELDRCPAVRSIPSKHLHLQALLPKRLRATQRGGIRIDHLHCRQPRPRSPPHLSSGVDRDIPRRSRENERPRPTWIELAPEKQPRSLLICREHPDLRCQARSSPPQVISVMLAASDQKHNGLPAALRACRQFSAPNGASQKIGAGGIDIHISSSPSDDAFFIQTSQHPQFQLLAGRSPAMRTRQANFDAGHAHGPEAGRICAERLP